MSIELSMVELDAECGELLPAREALGVFNTNWARIFATNSAMSSNVDSFFTMASSTAVQQIAVDQH